MSAVTADDLKKLDRREWQALLEILKESNPIDAVVQRSGAEYRLQRAGHELRGREHDSLIVDPHKGLYQWHSQGEAGDVFNWLMQRHHVDLVTAVLMLANEERRPVVRSAQQTPPPPQQTPETPPLPQDLHLRYHRALDPAARQWWYAQGVTDQGIARFFLGVCDDKPEYGRAYAIPVIEGGKLVNLRLRLAEPKSGHKDKYRPWARGYGTQLFNRDILTPDLGAVVITAGEKKAVVLWEHGIPAVSPTGGCGNWKPEWTTALQFCRKVFIAYDPTEQPAAWKLAEQIGDRAFVAQLPDKPDDFITAHGRDAFRRCLADAEPYADRDYWRKQLGGRNLWGRTLE